MGLKIAVVGGGSTYTPELVEGFEVRRDRMPIDELVLLDTDPERLRVVGGLARRMLDVRDWTGRLTCTGDRDAAIDGADFVLIQLRVGGQAARLVDETLPPTVRRRSARRPPAPAASRRRSGPCRSCWSSPRSPPSEPPRTPGSSTSRTRSGSSARPSSMRATGRSGLCNMAINVQRGMAERFGVVAGPGPARARRAEPSDLGARDPRGRRRSPARAHRVGRRRSGRHRRACPARCVRAVGAIPSYYLRYYYQTRQVVEDQRAGHTRAQEVIDIEHELLEMYRGPGPGREAGPAREPRRRLLQRGRRAAHRLAARWRRRRAGGRRAQRRRPPRPARRRRGGDPGHDRSRRRPSPAAGAARARHARPRPGHEGLRAASPSRPRSAATGRSRSGR